METMKLPQDDYLLLSVVNTKLRDEYDSLDELCADYGVPRVEIETRLGKIGYKYHETLRAFR